ncbi:hypothetical protein ACFLQ6_09040 [Thermoproteota archaeon]
MPTLWKNGLEKAKKKWIYANRQASNFFCKNCERGFIFYRTWDGNEYTIPKAKQGNI